MRDQDGIAADAPEPGDDVVRILHAATEQEQLRFRRSKSEREFVVHAANGIGDHLVFVDDEQLRAVAAKETGPLRFQSRDENFRAEIDRQVAGGNADIPAAGAPFRQFVVRESARRDGENRLPFQRRIKQLEDVSLARTGGRLDDDVFPIAKRAHGVLLPEIGDDQIDFEAGRHRKT